MKAVVGKLRTDDELVRLTKHKPPKDLRIARVKPPIKGKSPFLGVKFISSVPRMPDTATAVQDAIIEFVAISTDEILSAAIADRLEDLLHPNDNVEYYDFSSSEISNRSTLFTRRDVPVFDDDNDMWKSSIFVDIVWVNSPC